MIRHSIEQIGDDFPDWIANQLPVGYRRYRFSVDDLNMHFMEWGEPKGFPVLMQHGNPTWGFLYRKIVGRLLRSGFRFIVPDLIGFGFSSKPRNAKVHTLDNHALWLGSLLDALNLERLLFVGQDWGGPIGVRALAERPGLMAGMVVLNTVLAPPPEDFRPTAFHRFANRPVISDIAFRLLGYPQRSLGMAQADPDSISGNVAKAYKYPLRWLWRNTAPLALARMVPPHHNHPSIDGLKKCKDYLAAFSGPVAIVWGEKDPVLGRYLKRIEQQFPGADISRTGGGHFIQEEYDQLIANKIQWVADQISSAGAWRK